MMSHRIRKMVGWLAALTLSLGFAPGAHAASWTPPLPSTWAAQANPNGFLQTMGFQRHQFAITTRATAEQWAWKHHGVQTLWMVWYLQLPSFPAPATWTPGWVAHRLHFPLAAALGRPFQPDTGLQPAFSSQIPGIRIWKVHGLGDVTGLLYVWQTGHALTVGLQVYGTSNAALIAGDMMLTSMPAVTYLGELEWFTSHHVHP